MTGCPISQEVHLQEVKAVVTLNEGFEVFITTEQYEVLPLPALPPLALSAWTLYSLTFLRRIQDGFKIEWRAVLLSGTEDRYLILNAPYPTCQLWNGSFP